MSINDLCGLVFGLTFLAPTMLKQDEFMSINGTKNNIFKFDYKFFIN